MIAGDVFGAADVESLVVVEGVVKEVAGLSPPHRRAVQVECVGQTGKVMLVWRTLQGQGVIARGHPAHHWRLDHGHEGVLGYCSEHWTLCGHLAPQPPRPAGRDGGEPDLPLVRHLQVHLQAGDREDLLGVAEGRVEPVEALVVMVPLDAVKLSLPQLVVTIKLGAATCLQ